MSIFIYIAENLLMADFFKQKIINEMKNLLSDIIC